MNDPAKLYSKHSSYQEEVAIELLEKIDVSPGSLVLDLGCGTGYLATVLSEMVGPEGKVVAVDPDAERIKIAKEKNAKPNINYLVADDQSFPGDGYTLIVATHVIHWIENKEALFGRIYDKLAVGGKFAFVTSEGDTVRPWVMKKAFRDLISPDFEENVFLKKMIHLNVTQYRELAASTRFHITSIDTVVKPLQWDSVDSFLNFWAGVSHGEFKVASIDPTALQDFKIFHEKELISEKVSYNMLYVVLTR